MHSAFVLHAVFVMVLSVSVFFIRAKQARRELDEHMEMQAHGHMVAVPNMPMDKGKSSGSIKKDESIREKRGSILERKDSIPGSEKNADIRVEEVGTDAHLD